MDNVDKAWTPFDVDIRMSTYDEETAAYALEIKQHVRFDIDPDEVCQRYDCSKAGSLGRAVEVADYPPGTWFYYGEGFVAVRRGGEDDIERIEAR